MKPAVLGFQQFGGLGGDPQLAFRLGQRGAQRLRRLLLPENEFVDLPSVIAAQHGLEGRVARHRIVHGLETRMCDVRRRCFRPAFPAPAEPGPGLPDTARSDGFLRNGRDARVCFRLTARLATEAGAGLSDLRVGTCRAHCAVAPRMHPITEAGSPEPEHRRGFGTSSAIGDRVVTECHTGSANTRWHVTASDHDNRSPEMLRTCFVYLVPRRLPSTGTTSAIATSSTRPAPEPDNRRRPRPPQPCGVAGARYNEAMARLSEH